MFNIPKNTLMGYVKKADSIKEGYAKFGPKRLVMHIGQFDELETALLKWFSARHEGPKHSFVWTSSTSKGKRFYRTVKNYHFQTVYWLA